MVVLLSSLVSYRPLAPHLPQLVDATRGSRPRQEKNGRRPAEIEAYRETLSERPGRLYKFCDTTLEHKKSSSGEPTGRTQTDMRLLWLLSLRLAATRADACAAATAQIQGQTCNATSLTLDCSEKYLSMIKCGGITYLFSRKELIIPVNGELVRKHEQRARRSARASPAAAARTATRPARTATLLIVRRSAPSH